MHFQKKFHFQYSGLSDSEYIQPCKILVENKNFPATHRNDVGKISASFRIRLKPDAKLQTQRPIKVPIQYCYKLNTLLDDSKTNVLKNQIWSTPHEELFLDLLFLIH